MTGIDRGLSPLISRDDILRQLTDTFADCSRGQGWTVLVTAPVASGKTALLRHFSEYARTHGATVVHATGSPIEVALPLGVLRQLVDSAPLRAETAPRARQLLDDGALTTLLSDVEPGTGQLTAQVLSGLTEALIQVAEEQPLVLVIDDLQFTDVQSLECLLYFIRRAREARALVVLSERERLQPLQPMIHSELVRQPNTLHLHLDLLPATGVAELVCTRLGEVTDEFAAECHAVSGGNPLLVQAIVDDVQLGARGARRPDDVMVVGENFAAALMSCLHRVEPVMLRVARAVALLGEPASTSMIGRLLDIGPAAAERAIAALSRAGLLDDGRFRHPNARAAVLHSISSTERHELQERAARLLYSQGAPTTEVAAHLVAFGPLREHWAFAVLKDAADQALDGGHIDRAAEYLHAAAVASEDDEERAAVKAAVLRAEWRVDPANAVRHLSDIVAAQRRGHLEPRQSLGLIKYLLWYGRLNDALAELDRIERLPEPGAELADDIIAVRRQLVSAYPSQLRWWKEQLESASAYPGPLARPRPPDLLMLLDEGGDDVVARAETALQRPRLDEHSVHLLFCALSTLVLSDQVDTAERSCTLLLNQACERRASTWQAMFTALHASIALRRGDLPLAERQAKAALTLVPPPGWGVTLGGPISVLVLTAVAMGKHARAAEYLDIPVPRSMFQTPSGLFYLLARGRFTLASDQPRAALSDFYAAGELAERWGLDSLAGLVPWRVEAARAHLRLGRQDQARELVDEQMRRIRPGPNRAYGAALRVRAGTLELWQRPAQLREAMNVLRTCGDRLELANAFADLADVYHALGESSRARLMVRLVNRIAKASNADMSRDGFTDDVAAVNDVAASRVEEETVNGLSNAERRVATLAAQGHTNREIADQLYVTVSTVEQHLTRVYRKLGVTRRADLPTGLQPEARTAPERRYRSVN